MECVNTETRMKSGRNWLPFLTCTELQGFHVLSICQCNKTSRPNHLLCAVKFCCIMLCLMQRNLVFPAFFLLSILYVDMKLYLNCKSEKKLEENRNNNFELPFA
jgi:hypothetical protein